MKLSLRTKLIGTLVVAAVLPLALCLVTIGIVGYRHLVGEVGAKHAAEAAFVAHNLRLLAQAHIAKLDSLLALGDVPRLVEEESGAQSADANSKQRMLELDALWPRLPPDSPAVRRVLGNELSERLNAAANTIPLFVEVLVADAHGCLMAATGKPSDYYQGDETWWRRAMELKEGEVWIAGLAFDDHAGTFWLDLATPIFTGDDAPSGVLKATVNISPMFASIPLLSSNANTVREIVRPDGGILGKLLDHDFIPERERLPRAALDRLGPAGGWFIGPFQSSEPSMVGYAPFQLSGVSGGAASAIDGHPLFVVVHQPARSVLRPLASQLAWLTAAGAGIILACAVGGFFVAKKAMVNPIQTLREAAGALAAATPEDGAEAIWSRKPPAHGPALSLARVGQIRTGDEIEDLALDFSVMAERLLHFQAHLQEEVDSKAAEIEEDLEMARDFQQAFLPRDYPRVPSNSGNDPLSLHFHHLYRAAMSVGGDFFEILAIGDHRAGVLIADVMGHGTRSALVTAILRTLLHTIARTAEDPGVFLAMLNRHFHDALKQADQLVFASACYLVADTQNAVVRSASAGHPSPIVANRRTCEIRSLFGTLKDSPALGLFPDTSYQVFTRPLHQDDLFVMFTDGILEAPGKLGSYFGRERLERVVRENLREDLAHLSQAVVEAITDFAGSRTFPDDICLVTVEAVANTPAAAGQGARGTPTAAA